MSLSAIGAKIEKSPSFTSNLMQKMRKGPQCLSVFIIQCSKEIINVKEYGIKVLLAEFIGHCA